LGNTSGVQSQYSKRIKRILALLETAGTIEDMDLPDGTIIPAEQIQQDIRDQGSVIVFDSRDFHRVTPCTKGTRYSIVCWTVGPNFI